MAKKDIKTERERVSKEVTLLKDYGRNKKGDKILINKSIEGALKDKKVI